MDGELSNAEKIRKLPWALSGDACNIAYFYLAFIGPIFLIFQDKLGLSKGQIGVLLAIAPFTGLIAPFTGPLAARFGFKRTYVFFWSLRTIVMAGMIAAPWVVSTYGLEAGFAYVACIVILFSLFRTTGESAVTPWSQQYVPPNIRGKFTAVQNIIVTSVSAATIAAASRFLGHSPPTSRFLVLFGIAFGFGILAIYLYANVSGGAPDKSAASLPTPRTILLPLKDSRFRRFLLAHAVVNVGWSAATCFLPLFMRDRVGLPNDQVILLDAATMMGILFTSYFWGWANDRFGARPFIVCCLAFHVLYPLGMLLIPRHSAMSNPLALLLYFSLGVISPGWVIGYWRYFFVNLIPPEHKTAYISLNTANIGLALGIGPLLASRVIQFSHNLSGTIGPFHIDPYTPLFVTCFVCVWIGAYLFSGLPDAGAIPVKRFKSFVFQGSPLAAMGALIAYHFAGEESKKIDTVRRLAESRNPIGNAELIKSLTDPSFNVRYEAILSIGNAHRDPQLTDALIQTLHTNQPELCAAAAWALGRIGDPVAVPHLREMLGSRYRSIRAWGARALGMLADSSTAPALVELYRKDTDPAVRAACAAAFAAQAQTQMVPELLAFLQRAEDAHLRSEISLAIATLLGRSEQAMRLWRRMHDHPGDTLAGVMLALRRRLTHPRVCNNGSIELVASIEECGRAFGAEDYPVALVHLRKVADAVRIEAFTECAQVVLPAIRLALDQHGHNRREYILLAVHTLHVGLLPC